MFSIDASDLDQEQMAVVMADAGSGSAMSLSQEDDETDNIAVQKFTGRLKKKKKGEKNPHQRNKRRKKLVKPRSDSASFSSSQQIQQQEEGEEEDEEDYSSLNELVDAASPASCERDEASDAEVEKIRRGVASLSHGVVVNRAKQQAPPPRPTHQRRIERPDTNAVTSEIPLFYDDENFSPDDHVVRRAVYRAFHRANLPDAQYIRSISVFNFTEKDFDRPGATQWYHLKQGKLDLLNSIMAALCFATGQKERKQPPEKSANQHRVGGGGGKKKSKRARSTTHDTAAAEAEEEDADPLDGREPSTAATATDAAVEELRYIKGNDSLALFIETLVQVNRVKGFRLWLFDTDPHESLDPLLSRGLTEAFLESREIADAAQQQLIALATGGQTNKRGGPGMGSTTAAATTLKHKNAELFEQHTVKREFHYTQFADHTSHFMNVTKPYFTGDPCLSLNDRDDDQVAARYRRLLAESGEEAAEADVLQRNEKIYRDDREYMTYDTLTNEAARFTSFTDRHHPCNVATLFSKEAAMINYVCDEGVDPVQCQLSSYCRGGGSMAQPGGDFDHLLKNMEDEDQDEKQLIERLNYAVQTRCSDKAFEQFPLPNITYEYSNFFMSSDFVMRIPLPHRIGSQLYTEADKTMLERMLGGEDDVDVEMAEPGGDGGLPIKDQLLFGLHSSECELTADLMLYNPQHLDPDTLRAISRTHPTRQARLKFARNKSDEINTRLRLITSNLSLKGRIFICPAADEQIHALHDAKAQHKAARRKQAEQLDAFSNAMNYTNRSGVDGTLPHHTDMRQMPYLSCTPAGRIGQNEKLALMRRLVMQYIREMRPEAKTRAMRDEEKRYEDLYYRKKVASGYIGFFKEELEKWRPYSNTMESIRTELRAAGAVIETEDTFLRRSVFLRLSELNKFAYKNFAAHWYTKDGQVPRDQYDACMESLRRMQDAMTVEFYHEFFTNADVSLATLGVRSDLMRKPLSFASHTAATTNEANRKRVGIDLPVHDMRRKVKPFAEMIIWINAFFADQAGIALNFKTSMLMYFCRLHHSRWHPECNNPKLNVVLQGNGMAGKSKIIQLMKKICATGIGDMVTHITDQAFNVDRNLDDILLMYEEFQNKFLGYSGHTSHKNAAGGGGGGGGVSVGSDKDTSNFFKARLTSGKTTTYSWFDNEETGKRDVKISHASVQGNLMGASNNDFTDADPNVLSRLILISIPKSKFIVIGKRPQDRTKSGLGEQSEHNDEMNGQHKAMHAYYFLTEKLVQSYVLGNNKYGVEMNFVIPLQNEILDRLEGRYGIQTGDVRKREYVTELTRCMALQYAVWMGVTSELTAYLQRDPFDTTIDIGFSPLVIVEGIFPFMVGTKEHLIMALTSLSCLWYNDFQDLILEAFALKKCHLNTLREQDFLVRAHHEDAATTPLDKTRGQVGDRTKQQKKTTTKEEVDYNYIKVTGRSFDRICSALSMSLGDFVVASSEISRLLTAIGTQQLNVDSYTRVWDEEHGAFALRLSGNQENFRDKDVVERLTVNGTPTLAILVHFLRKKLANKLPCHLIDDPGDALEKERVIDDLYASLDNGVGGGGGGGGGGGEEMRIDGDLTFDERVAQLSEVNQSTHTLMTQAIRDVLENRVLENAQDERFAQQYDVYRDPVTGVNPIFRYITADPPRSVKMSEFEPESKEWIERTKFKDSDIILVDKLLMLPLQPKQRGKKMVIHNHNTIAPSVYESLSVYKPREGHLMKKRVAMYAETESLVVDKDLDLLACQEHMRNIGERRLLSCREYNLINFPPSTFAALMRNKTEEEYAALSEYPNKDIAASVNRRKRDLENERFPHMAKHTEMSAFCGANFEGYEEREDDVFIGCGFRQQEEGRRKQRPRKKARVALSQ